MFVWSCSETEVLPSGQEPNVLPDEWYGDTEEQHERVRLPRLHSITFISKAFVWLKKKKKSTIKTPKQKQPKKPQTSNSLSGSM